jgi:hypothetical protein
MCCLWASSLPVLREVHCLDPRAPTSGALPQLFSLPLPPWRCPPRCHHFHPCGCGAPMVPTCDCPHAAASRDAPQAARAATTRECQVRPIVWAARNTGATPPEAPGSASCLEQGAPLPHSRGSGRLGVAAAFDLIKLSGQLGTMNPAMQ